MMRNGKLLAYLQSICHVLASNTAMRGPHLSAPEPSKAWRKKSSRIAFLSSRAHRSRVLLPYRLID